MNHFISGILKIVLLEGSIALLLIDAVAGDRFEKVRARAHGVLAGLMVFAWCNYGSLRHDIDVLQVLTSIPLILFCGVVVGFAFDPKREERAAALVTWAKADPRRFSRSVAAFLIVAAVTLGAALGFFPAGVPMVTSLFFQPGAKIFAAGLIGLSSWFAGGVASGQKKLPSFAPKLVSHAKPLAVALVVILSGAWVGGGVALGKLPLVHQWEQFHFYLGAKYQREVGWFNLYKAAVLADQETVHVLGEMPTTRDLTNFEQVPLDVALRDAAQVRARFSDEQWQAFKNDWATMARLWPMNWTSVMNDHGNSNSPGWAIIAHPITRLIPLSAKGQALLGWIDMLLMLGLWLAVWQSFGHRAASVGLFMWAAPPLVFDYLSGSFLRWDWLFAIGLAACFLKQKRYTWAGGFFGFALVTKLFPLFFGVALGLRALFVWRETKVFKKEYLRFGVSAAAVGAVAVVLSTLMFGGSAWKEYAQRIEVAQVEKFYAIQYSFRSVYLQHAAMPLQRWGEAIFPPELAQRRADVELCKGSSDSAAAGTCSRELKGCGDGHAFAMNCSASGDCTCTRDGVSTRSFTNPNACAQTAQVFEQECGYPKDYSFGFFIGRLLMSLLILVLIRRAEDVEAFLLGPLLVFTWLTVNMYYWNMLGFLALGLLLRSERPQQRSAFGMLIGLHVVFMTYYLYQHLNRGLTEGYAVAWMLTALIIGTAIAEFRAWRQAGAVETAPARVS
jgi:hypothetical protein